MNMAKRILYNLFPKPQSGLTNASTRNSWVAHQLANLAPGSRILDAGAGECQYKKHCENLIYVSQDFTKYDGSGNAEGLQTGKWDTSSIDIVCDITKIPEDDKSFDAILCTEVLEHLPNPTMALKEFARLLKPGGTLILTAPFVSMTHFAPYHYCTGFNKYFYDYHLHELGFSSITVVENGNYFEFMAQEVRRVPSMSEQYAGIKPGFVFRALTYFILLYLDRFSATDNGSQKLMSYDLQVLAIR